MKTKTRKHKQTKNADENENENENKKENEHENEMHGCRALSSARPPPSYLGGAPAEMDMRCCCDVYNVLLSKL